MILQLCEVDNLMDNYSSFVLSLRGITLLLAHTFATESYVNSISCAFNARDTTSQADKGSDASFLR